MVKGFFDKFGCQQTRVYDVGITEYGTPGNPVVYAKCDFGAPKTLVFYWMYDTMPVTQPENWIAPPFEGRVVTGEMAAVPGANKVLVGRGATNTKGPQMIVLNALTSLKEVMGGKLPVNIIFVAEGDEERMSIGLRQFMKQHSDLFKEGDALYSGGPSEGLRLRRAHHQRQVLGQRADRLRHPRHLEALRRLARLASYPDARLARLQGWQHPPLSKAFSIIWSSPPPSS